MNTLRLLLAVRQTLNSSISISMTHFLLSSLTRLDSTQYSISLQQFPCCSCAAPNSVLFLSRLSCLQLRPFLSFSLAFSYFPYFSLFYDLFFRSQVSSSDPNVLDRNNLCDSRCQAIRPTSSVRLCVKLISLPSRRRATNVLPRLFRIENRLLARKIVSAQCMHVHVYVCMYECLWAEPAKSRQSASRSVGWRSAAQYGQAASGVRISITRSSQPKAACATALHFLLASRFVSLDQASGVVGQASNNF